MAIITISRQIGSGGDHIASLVAFALGYKLANKHILLAEAQKRGLVDAETANSIGEGKPGFLEHFDEKRIRAFYAIKSIMRELSDEGNLVIVGRGAHHELKGYKNVIRVRIIADKEVRIDNLMEEKDLERGEAKKLVKQNDREQAEYIKYFFSAKHSDEEHYDLIINSSRIPYSACAGIITQVAGEVGAMRIMPSKE